MLFGSGSGLISNFQRPFWVFEPIIFIPFARGSKSNYSSEVIGDSTPAYHGAFLSAVQPDGGSR